MCSVDKGRYAESDIYWAHAPLSTDERADVLLITDRCVQCTVPISVYVFATERRIHVTDRRIHVTD